MELVLFAGQLRFKIAGFIAPLLRLLLMLIFLLLYFLLKFSTLFLEDDNFS